MGDGFYRSKDPTNSIKVLKEIFTSHYNTTTTNSLLTQQKNLTTWVMWDYSNHHWLITWSPTTSLKRSNCSHQTSDVSEQKTATRRTTLAVSVGNPQMTSVAIVISGTLNMHIVNW